MLRAKQSTSGTPKLPNQSPCQRKLSAPFPTRANSPSLMIPCASRRRIFCEPPFAVRQSRRLWAKTGAFRRRCQALIATTRQTSGEEDRDVEPVTKTPPNLAAQPAEGSQSPGRSLIGALNDYCCDVAEDSRVFIASVRWSRARDNRGARNALPQAQEQPAANWKARCRQDRVSDRRSVASVWWQCAAAAAASGYSKSRACGCWLTQNSPAKPRSAEKAARGGSPRR